MGEFLGGSTVGGVQVATVKANTGYIPKMQGTSLVNSSIQDTGSALSIGLPIYVPYQFNALMVGNDAELGGNAFAISVGMAAAETKWPFGIVKGGNPLLSINHLGQIMSYATGVAPFSVASNVNVPNLNASLLSNMTATSGAAVSTIVSRNSIGDSSFNNVYAERLVSNVAQGTAPLIVASTSLVAKLNSQYVLGYTPGNGGGNIPINNGTLNTNLNAQYINGYPASTSSAANSIAVQDANQDITVRRVILNMAQGTAPLVVTSNTKVDNFHADYLDGYHAGNAAGQIPISNGTVNANLNAAMVNGYSLNQQVITTGSPTFAGLTLNGTMYINGAGSAEKRLEYVYGTSKSVGIYTNSARFGAYDWGSSRSIWSYTYGGDIRLDSQASTGGRFYIDNHGIGGSPGIDFAIGDTDTGFHWTSDGVVHIYSNNVDLGYWDSSVLGMYKNITFPNANTGVWMNGWGSSGIYSGNGDAATTSTHNLIIKTWNGIGFRDYTDTARTVYNARNGFWDTGGGYLINGLPVFGRIPNFSGSDFPSPQWGQMWLRTDL